MSLRAIFVSKVTLVPTYEGVYVSGSDNTITVNGLDESETYTGSTDVPVSKHAEGSKALSSGTATLDLAALPGQTADETVNATGLKAQLVKLRNKATNANDITVSKGASNGHTLLGSSWEITLKPGQSVTLKGDEAGPDVASNNKTLDLTGTGSQELEYLFVFG